MKRLTLFAALILLGLAGTQISAFAHDDWFKKYDYDHDRKWNYDEYVKAQRDWEIAHHQKVMSDKELREYYDHHDKDKDGYWATEEMRRAHHW